MLGWLLLLLGWCQQHQGVAGGRGWWLRQLLLRLLLWRRLLVVLRGLQPSDSSRIERGTHMRSAGVGKPWEVS